MNSAEFEAKLKEAGYGEIATQRRILSWPMASTAMSTPFVGS